MKIETKKILITRITGFCVLLVTIAIFILKLSPIEFIDLKILDLFFRTRGTVQHSNNVAVVAIDEKSITRIGRWPWPRATFAQLIDRLTQYKCAVVALDIVFSEHQDKKSDATIASAFKHNGSVVPGMFFFTSSDEIKDIIPDVSAKTRLKILRKNRILRVFDDSETGEFPNIFTPVGINTNIPAIANAGIGAGYFNVIPDADGSIRHIPLIFQYDGAFYPSLTLKAVSAFTHNPIKLILSDNGVEQLSVGSIIPPVDTSGIMIINYCGPAMTIHHISAVDIMNKTIDPVELKDKIAIVGITATGLYDIRLTPFETVYPGVEIHANAIDNLLTGNYLYTPWWYSIALLVLLLFIALILSIVIPRLGIVGGSIISSVLFCIVTGASFFLFVRYRIWFAPAVILFQIVLTSGAISIIKFIQEEKERRFIKGAFGQYVSPQLVDELVHDPSLLTLGGEERVLTVLFTDIAGFTRISESISPKELVAQLNEYTTAMSDIIMEQKGTIDKYIGDAIMAFFGAPLRLDKHADKACTTAVLMQKQLASLNKKWDNSQKPMFHTRIGIHTGKMIVGNMGSRNKFNYTVLGDAVNLGSRLEGANKFYGTNTIISEATAKQLGYQFITRILDKVKVLGKEKSVTIYELMGLTYSDTDITTYTAFLQEYNAGIKLFYDKQWKKAMTHFIRARQIIPHDKPSYILLERCEGYLTVPPPDDWDGSYQFTSK